jgi:parallel beta-helix repeat protein
MILTGLTVAATIGSLIYAISVIGITPAQLATFLDMHAGGHDRPISGIIRSSSSAFTRLDRMNLAPGVMPPPWAGADVSRDVPRPAGPLYLVNTTETLRAAIESARPGDVIELLPGRYDIDRTIPVARAGLPAFPIIVRAESLGTVIMRASTTEAFKVDAPNWVFENLVMQGVCADDGDCDHAFHIVGAATNAIFRNLTLEDFNAHFKINAEHGDIPDTGRIEHVTLLDSHPRQTPVPVTPIDLDVASSWRVTDNFIADFAKAGGDRTSYGGYAKAAGSGNLFAGNVVFCEWKLRALPGQRIGLSFGGGGSDRRIRRDHDRLGLEQSDSVMRDNLIVACSDDGIYLNRSAGTIIAHNTLIDTAGIDVRFPDSQATVNANLVDGPIRGRDGGSVLDAGNLSSAILLLFAGQHPVRGLFADPAHFDLRWKAIPPNAVATGALRYPSGVMRPVHEPVRPGAFDDFSAYLAAQ